MALGLQTPLLCPMMIFACNQQPEGCRRDSMKFSPKTRATLTDSHFLVPLVVFCIGLALLITLR
jgi:hypothetical protein